MLEPRKSFKINLIELAAIKTNNLAIIFRLRQTKSSLDCAASNQIKFIFIGTGCLRSEGMIDQNSGAVI